MENAETKDKMRIEKKHSHYKQTLWIRLRKLHSEWTPVLAQCSKAGIHHKNL
jgi:hypothetical protein